MADDGVILDFGFLVLMVDSFRFWTLDLSIGRAAEAARPYRAHHEGDFCSARV